LGTEREDIHGPPAEQREGNPAEHGEPVVATAEGVAEEKGEDHDRGADNGDSCGHEQEEGDDEECCDERFETTVISGEAYQKQDEPGEDGKVKARDREEMCGAGVLERAAGLTKVSAVFAEEKRSERGATDGMIAIACQK
jgi:hypothetical protein